MRRPAQTLDASLATATDALLGVFLTPLHLRRRTPAPRLPQRSPCFRMVDTGASRGIGRAIAVGAGRAGASLAPAQFCEVDCWVLGEIETAL
jgi:hypothetical protein